MPETGADMPVNLPTDPDLRTAILAATYGQLNLGTWQAVIDTATAAAAELAQTDETHRSNG